MKSISVCSYLIFPTLLRAREDEIPQCTDGNTEAQGGELTYPQEERQPEPLARTLPLILVLVFNTEV